MSKVKIMSFFKFKSQKLAAVAIDLIPGRPCCDTHLVPTGAQMLGHKGRVPAWLRQAITIPVVCFIFQNNSEAIKEHGLTELLELLEKKE
jgi:hypothetical protein